MDNGAILTYRDAAPDGVGVLSGFGTVLRSRGTPGEQTMKKNKPGSRTTARQETEANLRATRHAYDEDEAEPSSQRTPVNWSRKQPILEYADHERTATDDTETPAGWLKKPVASAEGPTTAKEKAMHEAATDKDDRIWEVAEDLDEPITRQDDWEAKQMSSESADMSCAIMESSHGLGLMKVLACRTIIHVP
ncbi:hypothetical protein B0A48_18682 [Cryoendolithus antarcticus]|uniref:Uncharacterized protein n=1 Tax=Cryoendolithus antarcticus TaxID=1507870 RepID=A0A1V8S8H6_9PEZI|nr:hypothetical protein B0A48_18682 [Cryoendolithus antarcticus]